MKSDQDLGELRYSSNCGTSAEMNKLSEMDIKELCKPDPTWDVLIGMRL